jgi:hypothetical protein
VESVLADAIVLSATVAENPASAVGSSSVASVACSVDSEVLKVLNADNCELIVVVWSVICVCCPAPSAVVNSDTIAPILSPEPMPVEVISELPAADPEVEELAVPVEELMAELMETYLPWVA